MKFRLTETCKTTPAKESVVNKQVVKEDVAPTAVAPAPTCTDAGCTNKSDIADVHKEVELIDTPLFEDDKEHLDDTNDEVGDVVEIGADFADDGTSEDTDISLDGLDVDADTAPNPEVGIADELRTIIAQKVDFITALNQFVTDLDAYHPDDEVKSVISDMISVNNTELGRLQGVLLQFDDSSQETIDGIEEVTATLDDDKVDDSDNLIGDVDMTDEEMQSYLDIAENFTPNDIDLNTLED